MTVIAAYDDGDVVWIASDGDLFFGSTKTGYGSKLLDFHSYCIGFCGSIRVGDILQESNNFPGQINSIRDIRKLRDVIKVELIDKAGAGACDHEPDGTHPVSILIACPKGIYIIQEDYGVIKCIDGYGSVGAGEEVTLGALALAKRYKLYGKNLIKEVMTVALKHCTHAAGKIHITGIKKNVKN